MPFSRLVLNNRPTINTKTTWVALGLFFVGAVAFSNRASSAPPETAAPVPTSEQAAFFETKIRPVLMESCVSCHGPDAQQGGLRVDARAFLLKGGVSGPSLVPGDMDKSLLLKVMQHAAGVPKMPKGDAKLKEPVLADFAAWVKMGAPWPTAKSDAAAIAAAAGEYTMSTEQKAFWSLQPVKMPTVPAVKNKKWSLNPIDSFVLAKLEAKGLAPALPADRRTLLRRVTFDLIGLPPTPQETENFLADKSPTAYEKVVDRLLASPRYGERWARMWLDVARYADTKGYVFVEDRNYPNAYTYRDWVINAFNRDLPYDQFIVQQLAADRLPEVQNGPDKTPLAALGFLTIGRRFLNSQPDIIDDRIDVVMRGFEGATVACARCHDHKFDPIPTKDYYSLYGVFANSVENTPPISPAAISDPYTAHDTKIKAIEAEVKTLVLAEIVRMRAQQENEGKACTLPAATQKALSEVRVGLSPDDAKLPAIAEGFTPDAKTKFDSSRATVETLKKAYPPMPEMAMGLTDRSDNVKSFVFKRGNQGNRGDEVPRRFLLELSPAGTERPTWINGSGRLELARAIASPSNPRTARVMVNRLWLHHFGAGIVRTPADFGKQGERPTHPELLDYLAVRFTQDGWSIKKMHRLMVLSATYRQSSDVSPRAVDADPENRLLSHQNRRRLDLEQMRDSLLFASGKLDTSKVGGPSVQLWNAPFPARRTVYGFIERQNLPGVFRTFDFASPDTTNSQRFRTTVPQQALFMMNGPFAVEQANLLAKRPDLTSGQNTDDAQRIRRLYLRLFNRLPDADEAKVGMEYLHAPDEGGTMEEQAPPAWHYGIGGWDEAAKKVTFIPLSHYDNETARWQPQNKLPVEGGDGYASLGADGGHPGRDAAHAIIRRWVAPFDATLLISGTLRHPAPEGDGIRARIISSRTGKLGEWTAHTNEIKTDIARVVVKKGETLDFIVDCQANDGYDSFGWSPTLQTPKSNNGPNVIQWSAKNEFSGPRPATPQPLTRWERYAQALLMTNEFNFVD